MSLYPNSGSLQEQLGTPIVGHYEVKGDDRILAVLVKEIDALKSKMVDLETKKIIDETQLPMEILEANNMLPQKPQRIKRGRGYRPVLKSEIEEAQAHSVNESAAARWLGISQGTYKRYAKLYGIYKPKPNVRGKRAIFDPERGKYPLNKILEGKHPNVTLWTVKDKLLRSGMKALKCELCGEERKRTGDYKVPLLLTCKDGDNHNFKFENLQILCFNCTFLAGRGYIRRSKFKLDPDWIQEMDERENKKPSRY
jgi:hypothetical protein